MTKLSAESLASKVQAVYKSKKRDFTKVTTGDKLAPPPFWVDAPEPIKELFGLPGYAGKRIIQISGRPNAGKTTLGMLAMVAAQKQEIYVIFVDTEGKFSEHRFTKMGGVPKDLLLVRAVTIEQGFLGLEEYLNIIFSEDKDAKVLIVWDSIGGTPTEAEANADADESIQLATAAKVIKRNLRVIVPKWIDKRDICMIGINQNYANIGSVGRSNSGGEGFEYFSSLIIQLSRVCDLTRTIKGQQVKYGIQTRAKVQKNHLMQGEYTIDRLDFLVEAYRIKSMPKKKEKETKK